jgi:2-polyprenyl-3-methyl-5-hydroxy-6-metoxy-1,4-benzoquinol methylase
MKCRICGSTDLYFFYSQGNQSQYKYFRCRHCKLVNYDLSTGLDQEKYTIEYVDPNNEKHRQNRGQSKSYSFINKHIHSRGRMLDIGCGNGRLLIMASKDGWDVRGLELSEFYAKIIGERQGIKVFVANFLEFSPTEKELFDIITLRHVLEHLPDPIFAMNKINSLLNDGGYAMMEFPNIDGWESRFKRLLQKSDIKRKKYSSNYKPGHCNEYCEESFRLLAEKCGFKVLIWSTYSSKAFLNPLYSFMNAGSKARILIQKM